MIYKLCRKCKTKIIHPAVYCDSCLAKVIKQREEYKAARDSKYNSNRDPKYKEFYNSKDWKLLKEKKLSDEQYKCERCHGIAMDVHHIDPIQTETGWARRLDYKNLECLCVKCHNFRHYRFIKKDKNNTP